VVLRLLDEHGIPGSKEAKGIETKMTMTGNRHEASLWLAAKKPKHQASALKHFELRLIFGVSRVIILSYFKILIHICQIDQGLL